MTSLVVHSSPVAVPGAVSGTVPAADHAAMTASLQSALLAKKLTSYTRSVRSAASATTASGSASGSVISASFDDDGSSSFTSTGSACSRTSSLSAPQCCDECHPLCWEDEVENFTEFCYYCDSKFVAPAVKPTKLHESSHSAKHAIQSILQRIVDLTQRPLMPVVASASVRREHAKALEQEQDQDREQQQSANPSEELHAVQMQTFKTVFSTLPVVEKRPIVVRPETCTKPREVRINSDFLKLYALDYSCRMRNYLKLTDQELDLYQQEYAASGYDNVDDFLDDYVVDDYESSCFEEIRLFRDNLKIALISRRKLWANVVLPPRSDVPRKQHYVPTESTASLVRERGKFVPWLNLDDFDSTERKTIPPYGRLQSGTQFTVKGWCNSRWSTTE